MPIKQTNAHKNIKFPYEFENDSEFVLEYEFHHTAEYGPTLTITNLATGPLSLPVSAFADAVDYLREEGAIPGGKPVVAAPTAPPLKSKLAPTRVAGAAPVSPIVRQTQRQAPEVPTNAYADQATFLTSAGVAEQFTQPSRVAAKKPPVTRKSIENAESIEVDESEDAEVTYLDENVNLLRQAEETEVEGEEMELAPEFNLKAGMERRVRNNNGAKRIKKLENVPDED